MKKKTINIILIIIIVILILLPLFRDERDKTKTQEEVTKIRKTRETTEPNVELPYILSAESIGLEIPVLEEVNAENLINTAAAITRPKIEEGTNYSIAGHRNLRKGKNFNRLNDLQIGDILTLEDQDTIYRFKINYKDVVLPSNTEVLKDTGETEITLVTCHPLGISNKRLIIKGEMLNE